VNATRSAQTAIHSFSFPFRSSPEISTWELFEKSKKKREFKQSSRQQDISPDSKRLLLPPEQMRYYEDEHPRKSGLRRRYGY
jgi:hypothetical protein